MAADPAAELGGDDAPTAPPLLRRTVVSFLDDADVSTRKISDQFSHAKVGMTKDRYLGRRLTDRQTADVLDKLMKSGDRGDENCPKTVPSVILADWIIQTAYQARLCAARDSNPEPRVVGRGVVRGR